MRTEVPTLVIWGDRDAIIPVQHGYAVHAARPGSRLDVLPGLGHFPHVQSPTVVATAIEEFIDGSRDTIDHAVQVDSSLRRHASSAVEHRTLIDNLESRNRVEVAIGVLMGLRGCPQTEALSEFATAIHETGLSPAQLAGALMDVASGNGTSPHRVQAQHRWRHLLALRGLPGGSNVLAKVNHSVRVRYGPENDATIC